MEHMTTAVRITAQCRMTIVIMESKVNTHLDLSDINNLENYVIPPLHKNIFAAKKYLKKTTMKSLL